MKKRLKKYLTEGNEGFSLIELIIVIAIMAVLVGIVALAVIPYYQESQESKDYAAIGTVQTALSSSVAAMKVSETVNFELAKVASPSSTADKVCNDVIERLGSVPSLGSTKGKTGKIYCKYDSSTKKISVYIASSATGTPIVCDRLKDDSQNAQAFKVEN